jgi:hypothetical protein
MIGFCSVQNQQQAAQADGVTDRTEQAVRVSSARPSTLGFRIQSAATCSAAQFYWSRQTEV